VTTTTLVILIAAVAVVIVIAAVARSRRANDGVDTFRRQIDALSPEARRPVVDQVQNAAGRHTAADDVTDDDADDEDGADGT
jgi:cytochrome oxidase Cu insertion factor (SCO1/SenC/PrrC family)